MPYLENGIFYLSSKDQKLDFETLLRILPFIPVALTILSIAQEIIFYGYFRIRVVDYLTLNEALILALDTCVSFFLFTFTLAILSFLYHIFISKKFEQTKGFFILVTVATYLVLTYYLKEPKLFKETFCNNYEVKSVDIPQGFLSFLIEHLLYVPMAYILFRGKFFLQRLKSSSVFIVIFFGGLFLLYSVYEKFKYFDEIKAGYYCGTTIDFSDTTIVSDKNIIYLGKTQTVIFLYNKEKHKPTVLDAKNLNSITFETGFCENR